MGDERVLPGPIVDGHWLAAHQQAVRIVDVRWYLDGRSGQDAYLRGHLPGAVWLDIDTDLSDPATREAGRHPLPTPDRFASALGRVGIAAGTPVVAYDDLGGSVAARLWWLLHVLGEPVAVLDGGLDAWPGELVQGVTEVSPVERAAQPWPHERFVTAAELANDDGSTVVYDARTAERYAHGSPIDPRPGHIPGALSAPWAGNLGADGHFRSADELRTRFTAALDRAAVVYCGSGVTACHDLLALELAGSASTSLYPGSWSQWGADESRPVETGGAETG